MRADAGNSAIGSLSGLLNCSIDLWSSSVFFINYVFISRIVQIFNWEHQICKYLRYSITLLTMSLHRDFIFQGLGKKSLRKNGMTIELVIISLCRLQLGKPRGQCTHPPISSTWCNYENTVWLTEAAILPIYFLHATWNCNTDQNQCSLFSS